MRHGFASFDLVEAFANSGEKLQLPGNSIQARVIRQALDGFQGKLLIAHEIIFPEIIENCNGTMVDI